jgi:hypothetical protein
MREKVAAPVYKIEINGREGPLRKSALASPAVAVTQSI